MVFVVVAVVPVAHDTLQALSEQFSTVQPAGGHCTAQLALAPQSTLQPAEVEHWTSHVEL